MQLVPSVIVSLLICTLSVFSYADEQNTEIKMVEWAINPGPPFHILSEPYQHQGLCDVMLDRLALYTPQWQQKRIDVPQGRVTAILQAKHGRQCFPCMIKGAQAGVLYSDITHRYPPHQLITTQVQSKMMQSTMANPPPFLLASVINHEEWRFGYPLGRKYGPLQGYLDRFAERFPQSVFARMGEGETVNILKLISKGRLDWTIDYAMVLRYQQLVDPELNQNTPLVAVPLAENQDMMIDGAIGCPDNDWGREVIQTINAAIPKLAADPQFIASQRFWFDGVGELKHP